MERQEYPAALKAGCIVAKRLRLADRDEPFFRGDPACSRRLVINAIYKRRQSRVCFQKWQDGRLKL